MAPVPPGVALADRGQQGLKRRGGDPTDRELVRTRAKLGEMTMRLELASELLEKRGYGDDLRTVSYTHLTLPTKRIV